MQKTALMRAGKLMETGFPQMEFAVAVQGESHRKRELQREHLLAGRRFPCQDRATVNGSLVASDGTTFSFMGISDGHGGAPYFRSHKGAEFALQVVQDIVSRRMDRIQELVVAGDFDTIRSQLALAIVKDWHKLIDQDLVEHPITKEELDHLEEEKPSVAALYRQGHDLYSIYGCTLVSYFATKDFWFAIQIGDGDFALSLDGQEFVLPMPKDEGCFLNQTTSLCDATATKEFRSVSGTQIPKVVLCTSDGVANSFKTEDQVTGFYRSLFNLFVQSEFPQCQELRCKNQNQCDLQCKDALVREEICRYLPKLSKNGSGDDIALAAIVNFSPADLKEIQALQDYLHGCYIKHHPAVVADSKESPEQLMYKYFTKAERGKNAKAKFELALYHYNKADSQMALKKMKSAATAGYVEAMVQLADWYLEGYGGECDSKKARKLYEKAAALGHKDAEQKLARE